MAFCVTNKHISPGHFGFMALTEYCWNVSIRVTWMDSVASDFTFPEKRVLNVCRVGMVVCHINRLSRVTCLPLNRPDSSCCSPWAALKARLGRRWGERPVLLLKGHDLCLWLRRQSERSHTSLFSPTLLDGTLCHQLDPSSLLCTGYYGNHGGPCPVGFSPKPLGHGQSWLSASALVPNAHSKCCDARTRHAKLCGTSYMQDAFNSVFDPAQPCLLLSSGQIQ